LETKRTLNTVDVVLNKEVIVFELLQKYFLHNELKENTHKRMPAANTRFGASGGVTSNNLLCGI